jgi:hypothetical protein
MCADDAVALSAQVKHQYKIGRKQSRAVRHLLRETFSEPLSHHLARGCIGARSSRVLLNHAGITMRKTTMMNPKYNQLNTSTEERNDI